MANRCEIFCEILIAILLPPLGVCLRHGCCSVRFCPSLSYIQNNDISYSIYVYMFDERESWSSIFNLTGWVLALFAADYSGLYPWNNLCSLCHRFCRSWSVLWRIQASSLRSRLIPFALALCRGNSHFIKLIPFCIELKTLIFKLYLISWN